MRQLRVLWVVPGFPADATDSRYAFLGHEAALLSEAAGIDTKVVSVDGPAVRGPLGCGALRNIASTRDRLRFVAWLATHPSVARRHLSRRRSDWMPVLRRLWALDEVVRNVEPDLIHSHFAEPLGTAATDLARMRNVAVVVSLRGVDVAVDPLIGYGHRQDAMYDARLRSALARADRVLAATSQMAALAVDAGADRSSTVVSPNPAPRTDVSTDQGLSQLPTAPFVACVGSLDRRKSFETGVDALADLPGYHLVVAGDGPDRQALLNRAEELGLSDRLHLLGRVSPAQVHELLDQASVFWSTARFEAFGNAILEAATADCAMVCTRQGVAVDLVPHLDRAAFFDGSASDLARVTRGVLVQSASPRTAALGPFDRDEWRRRLVAIYQEVVDG